MTWQTASNILVDDVRLVASPVYQTLYVLFGIPVAARIWSFRAIEEHEAWALVLFTSLVGTILLYLITGIEAWWRHITAIPICVKFGESVAPEDLEMSWFLTRLANLPPTLRFPAMIVSLINFLFSIVSWTWYAEFQAAGRTWDAFWCLMYAALVTTAFIRMMWVTMFTRHLNTMSYVSTPMILSRFSRSGARGQDEVDAGPRDVEMN